MAIQGLRDTSNFVANERPENWRQGLLLLYPNSAEAGKAPLTALTSLMKTRSVDDPAYHWFEKSLDDRRFALHATSGDLTAPAAGTVDTITLASGETAKTLKAGDLLRVEHTGEILFVNADPASDTSFTVIRGFASTTPTAVDANGANVNPNLVVMGSAFEEGSLAPTGINFDPTEVYNYCQIFRSSLELTGTAIQTRLRTEDAVKEAKRECLEYIGVDMERAFFFGKRSTTTRNGKPQRTTNGLINYIPSGNTYSFASQTVTMAQIEAQMLEAFRYGSSQKMIFAGNRAIMALGTCIRKNTSAQWQIREGVKEYGMEVMKLTSPFGELTIKSHPLFNQMASSTNGASSQYYAADTWMWLLDMSNIQYVYVRERDLKYMDDQEANGMDGMKAGYLAECGLEVHHASTHSLWKNMYSGAADS